MKEKLTAIHYYFFFINLALKWTLDSSATSKLECTVQVLFESERQPRAAAAQALDF